MMGEDAYEKLVDDATHAVMETIPADAMAQLTAEQREYLSVAINDSLAETLDVFKGEPAPKCRTEGCDGDPENGEGWDGFCGNCADKREFGE